MQKWKPETLKNDWCCDVNLLTKKTSREYIFFFFFHIVDFTPHKQFWQRKNAWNLMTSKSNLSLILTFNALMSNEKKWVVFFLSLLCTRNDCLFLFRFKYNLTQLPNEISYDIFWSEHLMQLACWYNESIWFSHHKHRTNGYKWKRNSCSSNDYDERKKKSIPVVN